ncbi:hypothetical protein NL676_005740 [Syzygium grande]|nr:hypothetical protein NL676_005740 [Syzygium grande]
MHRCLHQPHLPSDSSATLFSSSDDDATAKRKYLTAPDVLPLQAREVNAAAIQAHGVVAPFASPSSPFHLGFPPLFPGATSQGEPPIGSVPGSRTS